MTTRHAVPSLSTAGSLSVVTIALLAAFWFGSQVVADLASTVAPSTLAASFRPAVADSSNARGHVAAVAAAQPPTDLRLDVSFNGTSLRCLIDTGATVTLLAKREAARVERLRPLAVSLRVNVLGGAALPGEGFLVETVATQDIVWRDARVIVLAGDMLDYPCVVGMDLLGRQPLVFDWPARRMYPHNTSPS